MAVLLKYKFLVLLVVIVGSIFLWWASQQQNMVLTSASHDKAISIWSAEQIIETGKAPENWPTSIFIPAKSIEALASSLVGATYNIPDDVDGATNKPKGNFQIAVDRFDLKVADGALSPEIQVSVKYLPNGNPPVWADSVVRIDIVGILQPSKMPDNSDKKDELTKVFRIVPLSITPKVNVWPLSLKTSELVAKIAAAQVIEKVGDRLYVKVPAISSAIKIDTNINTEQYSKFEEEGGYTLRQTMDGKLHNKLLQADNILITNAGIWYLGGLNLKEIPPLPLDDAGLSKWLESHQETIKEKTAPFQLKTDNVKAKISNSALVEVLEEIKKPRLIPAVSFSMGALPGLPAITLVPAKSMYEMNLHAFNATGVISYQSISKDDLLGNIGVKISPKTSELGKGVVSINIPTLGWKPGVGIEGKIAANVEMNANVHAHLDTAKIGGGVGVDVAVAGTTSATIPIQLKLESVSTAAGSAFVMRTILECTPIDIDTIPDASYKGIDFDIVQIATVKFRFKKIIGGESSSPSILLDSTPQYIIALKPSEKENQPGFIEKGFLLSLKPKTLSVTPDGLELEAGIDISPSEKQSADFNVEAKKALSEAVSKLIKGKECENVNDIEVLLGPPQLSNLGSLMAYVMIAVKEGQHVTAEAIKEAEKFYNNPVAAVTQLPENTIRETGKALSNIGNEAGKANEAAKGAAQQVCGDLCDAIHVHF
ncbi:hypothetical protein [Pseudomonas chlororaphis]|uniref:hypothetical protein n=1 Tax=Pseudomonas chlororaphis TaxID=587753 RepID=UPI001B309632|nr:hypothetical protein [Pseudomonas chlororaphis]QTT87541.1 hypothetical protein HUT28_09090 [Pseudomonas chlororaphis]